MTITTDDQIEIDVHDDAAALARVLSLPVSVRLEALAEMNGISAFDTNAMSRLRHTHEKRRRISGRRRRPVLRAGAAAPRRRRCVGPAATRAGARVGVPAV